MLREGRLELGEHVLLEPGVWLTAPAPARIRIGGGTFLNLGVQVAAVELVEIGEHCMFANGCFVTDANHRFDDPDKPVPWQGFTSKGPTRIGDNVWCGANVVITSGVTIGERCVIGANSVVTTDLPPFSIAAGAPARVLRTIEYPARPSLFESMMCTPNTTAAANSDEREHGEPGRSATAAAPCPLRRASAERALPSTTSENAVLTNTPASSETQTTSKSRPASTAASTAQRLRRQGPAGHDAPRRAPTSSASEQRRSTRPSGPPRRCRTGARRRR